MNYILKDESALFFECGYSCDNALLLKIAGEKFFLTDARYFFEAQTLVKQGICVVLSERNLIKDARAIIRKFRPAKIAFNPQEMSVASFEALFKGIGVRAVPRANFSQISRIVKTEDEIKILKRAARLGAERFDEFAAFVRENGEGMSERELFFNAELIFKKRGELDLSFSPIVAINENAAKAHALPSEKRLRAGDLLLLDAGVKFGRYCSDRTRTAYFDENFNFGKEQNFKDARRKEIYEIVKEAQARAIAAVMPGKKAREIDAVARNFIAAQGFGREFYHSTGHGVGVDIHELPVISARSETVIKEGMVFSVEPGIYLPGELGVRIEDVVVARADGAEIL